MECDDVTDKDVVFGDPIVGKLPEVEDPGKPVPLRCPKEMTPEQFAKHCVTRIPYEECCPYCVAGKTPNGHHRRSPSQRKIPFICADYGFITEAATQDVVPILVVYARPWRIYFATVMDTNGHDINAVKRLARWIRKCGLTHFVYRSDREQSIRKLIFEAVKLARVQAEELKKEDLDDSESDVEPAAVPEESHVGESQSNGRAERSVQIIKAQFRTMKLELEDKLQCRIPCSHPILTWLVEYCSMLVTKFQVGEDGKTGYQRLHGQASRDRLPNVCETIMFSPHAFQRGCRCSLEIWYIFGARMGLRSELCGPVRWHGDSCTCPCQNDCLQEMATPAMPTDSCCTLERKP